MPQTNETEQLKLLEMLEDIVKLRSRLNPDYEPWHKALTLALSNKLDEAALIASKACTKNFMDDPVKQMILDGISNLAVMNDVDGAGIECMWTTAADLGYLDLAYNAANQIIWRRGHKTTHDYELASRYFKLAIDNSDNPTIKYSALTNYAEIVRDGHVTGRPDWLGAIELYEEAGRNGLVNAMFNAGNVLLWLVEAGDRSYAARAQTWLETLIEHVESGRKVIDIGGREEALSRLKGAKIRLAFMHIDRLSDHPDLEAAETLLSEYQGDGNVRCMLRQRISNSLIEKCNDSDKQSTPWECVFDAMGWKFSSESFEFDLPSSEKSSASIIHVELAGNQKMTILSFDYFTHPDSDPSETYRVIAQKMSVRFEKPIFVVGTKGFFLRTKKAMFDVVHVAIGRKYECAPIWPGATSDQVFNTLQVPFDDRYTAGREDPANTIPRLVNAMDEGIPLEGKHLPNAIWIGVSELLAMPIHRPDEPSRIGLYVSQSVEELRQALEANALSQ